MDKKMKLLLLALFASAAAFSQQQSFTLQQAQDYGVANNTAVQSAALDIRSAQETVGERLSVGLPQLNGSVDYQNFIKLPTSLIPAEFFGGEPGTYQPVQFGTKQNLTAGLSFSQLIFNGSWLVGVNAAKTYTGLVESQKKVTENDVRKNVEQAYYTVLVSEASEEVWADNINNLSKTLRDVTEMNKQGFTEEIDVNRLQISLSNLQTNLENVKRQTELAKTYLKFTMGYDMNAPIELTDSLNSVQNDFAVIENDEHYLSRPEFDVLETTRALNEFNIKANKAGYLPSLTLIGSYQQNAQRNEFDFFDADLPWFETALIGVSLNVPIFDGLQKKHTIENARIGLEKAELTIKTATQGIQMEVAKAKTDYLNALNDLETQNQNIALAQKIYDVTLIKYQQGVGSSLELTTAESSLYQSQGAYIGAMLNVLTSKSNLKTALGY